MKITTYFNWSLQLEQSLLSFEHYPAFLDKPFDVAFLHVLDESAWSFVLDVGEPEDD